VVSVRSDEIGRLAQLLVRDDVTLSRDGADRATVTGMSSREIGQIASQAGIALVELVPKQASLEEAFMDITRDSVEFNAVMGVEP